MTTLSVDVSSFEKHGFVLVKKLFSPDDVSRLRESLMDIKNIECRASGYRPDPLYPQVVFVEGDLLSKPQLRNVDYILLDSRIVDCVKQLIGPEVVYFGDSSVQFGEGARGFHKDNVDKNDPNGQDWRDKYTVLRVGIYLQDHSLHSGGVKVRLNSHNYVSRHRGKSYNVPSELGDIVIWNLRTSHSGNNILLKNWQGLSLHPRLERLVPDFLKIPEQHERIAAFCSFGTPGHHLDRYIQYLGTRKDSCEHWRRSGVGIDVETVAKERGVTLRRPIPDYGALCGISVSH